ncbi:MAG: 50S ribosomal protein L15 [Acidobacteriota bacterium]
MFLSELKPAKGAVKKPKRIGRGPGSGHGKTAGKGHKGQKSRSGFHQNPGFEGGQMPLMRRIPKRGFTNIFAKKWEIVNVGRLSAFEGGSEVNAKTLKRAGLIRSETSLVKILGVGALDKAMTVVADAFSEKARQVIEAAGGRVEVRQP